MPVMIDTHAHLDVKSFDADRAAVIARALEAGVDTWVVPAIEPAATRRALAADWRRPGLHFSAGIHPHEAEQLGATAVEEVEALLLEHPEIVAVGEAGLDYFYHPEEAPRQKALFDAQVDLAHRHNRPLIVHARNGRDPGLDAFSDILEIIRGRGVRGVLHSFTGSWETASAALELGWFIGLNGIVTFNQSQDLREVAARLPLDRILVETDCPYLAPVPHRGRRNEPARIIDIVSVIAKILKRDVESLGERFDENARTLFRLGTPAVSIGTTS